MGADMCLYVPLKGKTVSVLEAVRGLWYRTPWWMRPCSRRQERSLNGGEAVETETSWSEKGSLVQDTILS